MEYPRYADKAQSFPTTIPFSESMGFVMDIDDDSDVDIPFFITAHEVAHQWWGMKLVAANVKGRHLILESLAQYSALMVMKESYGNEAVENILQLERERYEEGNQVDTRPEVPLIDVDDQDYIYYSKGAIQLHTLQSQIGEDRVNAALRPFIEDWNATNGPMQQERYPTSEDLLEYIRAVTPDSLDYLVKELFEDASILFTIPHSHSKANK